MGCLPRKMFCLVVPWIWDFQAGQAQCKPNHLFCEFLQRLGCFVYVFVYSSLLLKKYKNRGCMHKRHKVFVFVKRCMTLSACDSRHITLSSMHLGWHTYLLHFATSISAPSISIVEYLFCCKGVCSMREIKLLLWLQFKSLVFKLHATASPCEVDVEIIHPAMTVIFSNQRVLCVSVSYPKIFLC
jgi:hypothetical protein